MKIPTKYPKSFFMGGEEYTIKTTNRIKHCGDTNSESKLIRIRGTLSPREALATLIHEIFHSADFEYNIKLTHKQVYKLERAFISFLVDNFYLLPEDKK